MFYVAERDSMKVSFIGGGSNGLVVLDYLKSNKHVDVVDHYPELIFVAGHSELLKVGKIPIIGFHPSKLPLDRGRSVLAWQIEEGYTETALTMFYYSDIPDAGDIIAQEPIKIDPEDYISDVLKKIDKATYNMMRSYFPLIRQGKAQRIKQGPGTVRRLRNESDQIIDWDRPSREIYNKIRAISHPYPGALYGDEIIWRAEIVDFPFGKDQKPGTLIATLYNGRIIKTKDGFIKI